MLRYAIANWSAHENAEIAQVRQPSKILAPTALLGADLLHLRGARDGWAAIGVFEMLRRLAAQRDRGRRNGIFEDDDGRPMSIGAIGAGIGCEMRILKRALGLLCAVGWIECAEVGDDRAIEAPRARRTPPAIPPATPPVTPGVSAGVAPPAIPPVSPGVSPLARASSLSLSEEIQEKEREKSASALPPAPPVPTGVSESGAGKEVSTGKIPFEAPGEIGRAARPEAPRSRNETLHPIAVIWREISAKVTGAPAVLVPRAANAIARDIEAVEPDIDRVVSAIRAFFSDPYERSRGFAISWFARTFDKWSALAAKETPPRLTPESAQDRPMWCEQCGETLPSVPAFEAHVRSHESERLARPRRIDATEGAEEMIRRLKETVGIGVRP